MESSIDELKHKAAHCNHWINAAIESLIVLKKKLASIEGEFRDQKEVMARFNMIKRIADASVGQLENLRPHSYMVKPIEDVDSYKIPIERNRR